MRELSIMLLAFLGLFNAVYAQDIFLSTNQSNYYFGTGQDAMIPIQINNTYGKQISGSLQYTISQLISQGNVQLSHSNTQEKSLSIANRMSNVSLNVGKSETPANYSVSINYNYNVNGDRIVSLGPISVHFVSNSSNNTPTNARMQSSSKPNNQPQARQQDLFSQQQQQMQQQLNEMLGNQQDLFSQQQQQMQQQQLNEMLGNPQNQNQNQSQNPQQQLQNNQLSQDSNALKHQFENQVQKQGQLKKEFERKLFSNNDFLQKHQNLLKDGYSISNSDLRPVTNATGTFDIKYNNTNGKWATLQGNMKNGTLQVNEQTQVEQEKLLENLKQNPQYQQFNSKLLKEGFSPNNTTFQTKANQTDILLKYVNNKNENASIAAQYVNDNLKQVTFKGEISSQENLIYLLILGAAFISIIAVFLIKKVNDRKRPTLNSALTSRPKSLDYITGSKKLMHEAMQLHDKGQYKEAFEIAGKSLRAFLNGDVGINKEITNQELVQLIQIKNNNNYPLDDIRDCFKLTDLVQFAKFKPTESDFKNIVLLLDKLSSLERLDES